MSFTDVVMTIDQARHHDFPAGIDDLYVALAAKLSNDFGRRANSFDQWTLNVDRTILEDSSKWRWSSNDETTITEKCLLHLNPPMRI
jgi:hypothetical protein